MELKEFVKKVLVDLVDAVEEARSASSRDMHLASEQQTRTVEFDIAVSVEDSSGATGKAGINVLKFAEAGGQISEQTKNSTVSRVQFGVNVNYYTKNEEQTIATRRNSSRGLKI